MITLYTFGSYFGLPDASPFVFKGEMLLKIAGLEYRKTRKGLARGPKGKLPYIDDDGTIVADTTLIRLYLEQKYGIDFDRGLSVRDRGVAWATEKMLEDHLYWVLVYWRWMDDANFERGPANFFKRAPAIVRPIAKWKIRGNVRRTLHAQGIGRHSEAEMTVLSDRAFEALSQVLGDNAYLMGNTPCGADATAFAFIATALSPVFESPARAKARALPNLTAYRDRMMAEFYPEMGSDPPIRKQG
jgi:glutathione S-transferase